MADSRLAVALVSLALTGCGADGDRVLDPPAYRGVAIDIVFGAPAREELRDLDDAALLGADAVRVAVQWPGMEPARGDALAPWYLDRLDALVARARSRGIRVLLTPVFTPCWAVSRSDDDPCASPAAAQQVQTQHPQDPDDYARFVARLVERYEPDLAGIEVWNEPNLPGFWDPRNAAEDYVDLVRAVRATLLRDAPAVPLVAGAVAGGDSAFLAQLYEAGIGGTFDVLSLHVYNDGRAPDTGLPARFARSTFRQGLLAVRDTLRARGERRPVWITEIGWNTSTLRGAPFNDGVTPAQQASYLRRALRELDRDRDGVGIAESVFVYRLRDGGVDPADPQQNYGLLRQDRERKPAFEAVRNAFVTGRG